MINRHIRNQIKSAVHLFLGLKLYYNLFFNKNFLK